MSELGLCHLILGTILFVMATAESFSMANFISSILEKENKELVLISDFTKAEQQHFLIEMNIQQKNFGISIANPMKELDANVLQHKFNFQRSTLVLIWVAEQHLKIAFAILDMTVVATPTETQPGLFDWNNYLIFVSSKEGLRDDILSHKYFKRHASIGIISQDDDGWRFLRFDPYVKQYRRSVLQPSAEYILFPKLSFNGYQFNVPFLPFSYLWIAEENPDKRQVRLKLC